MKKKLRPSWDETFMSVAVVFAQRSMCKYYKVGAVIAREKQLLSVGYNGPVSGEPHCEEVGCAKEKDGKRLPSGSGLCRGAHAEINAICNAANNGVSIRGATLYVTYRPCHDCAKHIVNAGIRKVVYLHDYEGDLRAIELFNRVGVGLVRFDTLSQKKINLKLI